MVHHANTINHAFKLTLYIKIANPIPLTIPTIGRTGTNGTLNDGLYFELVFLNFINATQTILNKIKNKTCVIIVEKCVRIFKASDAVFGINHGFVGIDLPGG